MAAAAPEHRQLLPLLLLSVTIEPIRMQTLYLPVDRHIINKDKKDYVAYRLNNHTIFVDCRGDELTLFFFD